MSSSLLTCPVSLYHPLVNHCGTFMITSFTSVNSSIVPWFSTWLLQMELKPLSATFLQEATQELQSI